MRRHSERRLRTAELLLAAALLLTTAAPAAAAAADAKGRAALRLLSRSADAGLRSAIGAQLRRMDCAEPQGAVCRSRSCLLLTPAASSGVVKGRTGRRQVAAVAARRGLPAAVVRKLRAAAFSSSVEFRTFSFVVDTRVRRGSFQTFVGAARRVADDNVEFGVVFGTATAKLVRKTTRVSRKKCKRRFFIKRCRRWTEHVPRGNTQSELRLIERSLRHRVVAEMRRRLVAVPRRRRRSLGDCSTSLHHCVRLFLQQQQQQQQQQAASSNDTQLVRLVRRGFDRMRRTSSTQLLRGVSVSAAEAVGRFVSRSLRAPKLLADSLAESLFASIRLQPLRQWKVRAALYTQPEDAKLSFCAIFARRLNGTFDLAIARTSVSLSLADDLLVVVSPPAGAGAEATEQRMELRLVPRNVTDSDVRSVVSLLQADAAAALLRRLR